MAELRQKTDKFRFFNFGQLYKLAKAVKNDYNEGKGNGQEKRKKPQELGAIAF